MTQYIDKSALVAEIEKLKENARMSYSDYADVNWCTRDAEKLIEYPKYFFKW